VVESLLGFCGFGGSCGWADLENQLTTSYVTNSLKDDESPAFAKYGWRPLLREVYKCLSLLQQSSTLKSKL